jgi:choline dehydrogenase-like flavoprotein
MSESTVAIVGSGIAGSLIAHLLTDSGYDVEVFEKGPDYPYPHSPQFKEQVHYLYDNPAYQVPPDLKNHTRSRGYLGDLETERLMVVGGSCTKWEALTIRMVPDEFRRKSLYGYGEDWPISYDDLEPYYGRAEALLGVSGTDEDNPFAPPRSQPYPLPPFELSYDDKIMAERLKKDGITLHTTPQARTRRAYGDRLGCVNIAACTFCPIGARYSPNYHLQRAVGTGLCTIHSGTSVRRIVVDQSGRARTLVYQTNDAKTPQEHAAKLIIVAAGAIESARLLLLSKDARDPDGVGNRGGQVGRHLTFHSVWRGHMQYDEALYPGRFGGWTGQSAQFRNPPQPARHTGVKVEFASFLDIPYGNAQPEKWRSVTRASEVMEQLRPIVHRRQIALHSESVTSERKFVTLSRKKDRFSDPFAHVQYELAPIDYETYKSARTIFDRFAGATKAKEAHFPDVFVFDSGGHQMGTCRMGKDEKDSVVNSFGQVHNIPNLFVVGPSSFVGTSGTANPTLTVAALAIRTADHLLGRLSQA